MPYRVFMPKAGMAMEEGTILRWFKKEGDSVTKGEPLLEIETDKVGMDVEAPESGFLLRIVRREGDVVPVTETVGFIGQKGETVAEEDFTTSGVVSSEATPSNEQKQAANTVVSKRNGSDENIASRVRIAATPKARRLAEERVVDLSLISPSGKHGEILARDVELEADTQKRIAATPLAVRVAEIRGIDIAKINGSGPRGRVLKSDVLTNNGKQSDNRPDDGLAAESKPMSGMRRTIAKRMLASHRQIPAVTLNAKADVSELLELRARLNEERPKKITLNDFVVKACAAALKHHPNLNVRLSESGYDIVHNRMVNIGIAVALEDGLLVPVIRDADKLSLSNLSTISRDLVGRAREGNILPDELSASTFTVSNLGMYGIVSFNPIINLPESAVLGVCTAESTLALKDGSIDERQIMGLSLTIDHRVIDGAAGALFLNTLKELLEHPLILVVD
jgi:pyruvate dehydrogenase E2 component (dihydrolipoamide acetyltransferase)